MTQELGFSLAGYGNVVELRINSGGKLPNFGFVVFDDPEPVQKILSSRVNKILASGLWSVGNRLTLRKSRFCVPLWSSLSKQMSETVGLFSG